MRWREAMASALYGPGGFYRRESPVEHFRTSVTAAPVFAGAIVALLERVDTSLGHPDRLDVVDVGAGRGELLCTMLALAPPRLSARLHPVAVEVAPRPAELPDAIDWRDSPPSGTRGLLMATEWLDNVPLELAEYDEAGEARYLHTDDSLGDPVAESDAAWLRRWWLAQPGTVAEIGLPRDDAWSAAVSTVDQGLALTVDYGHLLGARPPSGTLVGYRAGRAVPPVPDGSCDLTAHVAMDAVAAASETAAGAAPLLTSQREMLSVLGVTGTRPPLSQASVDPEGYLRALGAASAGAELIDPAGLGAHYWLLQPVGIPGLRFQA